MLLTLPTAAVDATGVRLFTDVARSQGQRDLDVTPVGDGTYSADTSLLPAGRWYVTVVGHDLVGEVTWESDYIDTPEDSPLVVSPESVAVAAKMPLPLTPDQRETIIGAIEAAQDDVVGHLGRSITPQVATETDRWSWGASGEWDLVGLGDEPLIRVIEAVPQVTGGIANGYFTVTYEYGIDARTDPELSPIRRYVRLHAMNAPEFVKLWKVVVKPEGDVKSLSAEGQSVSFDTPTLGGGGKAGSGDPGALPNIASLDRWRLAGRRVHQGRTRASDWPFSGARW